MKSLLVCLLLAVGTNCVAQNVGIGTTTPVARFHVADSNVLFTGPVVLPLTTTYYPPAHGAGTRMMWYPQKAAFRVGYTESDSWDFNNIGTYSFANGYSTKASGLYSTAMGLFSIASGESSIATGESLASGYFSTAMGTSTASGYLSTAIGSNTASGDLSTAMGYNTQAKSFGETTVGSHNTDYTPLDPTGWNVKDRLFTIGNGTNNFSRSDAMVILKNGNIGIGESNPAFPLNFYGSLGDKISFYGNVANGSSIGFGIQSGLFQMHSYQASDDIAFGYGSSSNFAEQMRIKGNGNVGIGINPTYKLHLGNSINGLRIEGPAATGSGGSALNIGGAGDIIVDAPGVVGGRLLIKENGNVGISNNLPAYKLDVFGDINAAGQVRASGVVLTSDARFKQNITAIPNALNNLLELRGTNYFFNTTAFPGRNFSSDKQMGVIAQEVEKIFPELVSMDKDGYKSVNYIGLIPVMIESIKEQQSQIEKQNQQIEKLTQLVNQLLKK